MLKTVKEVRQNFWLANPHLPTRRIRDHSGSGLMYQTDTRCAFVDYVDMLHRSGQIDDKLAQTVTLG